MDNGGFYQFYERISTSIPQLLDNSPATLRQLQSNKTNRPFIPRVLLRSQSNQSVSASQSLPPGLPLIDGSPLHQAMSSIQNRPETARFTVNCVTTFKFDGLLYLAVGTDEGIYYCDSFNDGQEWKTVNISKNTKRMQTM